MSTPKKKQASEFDDYDPDFARDMRLRAETRMHEGIRARLAGPMVAKCGCGKSYAAGAFGTLTLVGAQHLEDPSEVLELRNCACGSTIARLWTPPPITTEENHV